VTLFCAKKRLSGSTSDDLKVKVARVAREWAKELADVAKGIVPYVHDRPSEAEEGALEGTIKDDGVRAIHERGVLFAPLDRCADPRSDRDHTHLEGSSGSADLPLAALTSLD
jgi:hypothetical protein